MYNLKNKTDNHNFNWFIFYKPTCLEKKLTDDYYQSDFFRGRSLWADGVSADALSRHVINLNQ